jgi:hypothetical protein
MKNKINNILILISLIFISLFSKWFISIIYTNSSLITKIILIIEDVQYFPIIISIANLDFSPTYQEIISNLKILSFPLYGVVVHSLFYKIIGVYSFIILEFVFKFIFFLVMFIAINKVFKNINKTIYFCIFILFTILIFKLTSFITDNKLINISNNLLNENFGSRMPRPLLTGIFYFLFYIKIINLKKKVSNNLNLKYFIIVVFILSLFLNSFFYYFINFSILFLILLCVYAKEKFFFIIFKNKLKIFIILFFFLIFASPFLIQLYISENDYNIRMGAITIEFEQKNFLIRYYLNSLLRLEFLCIFIPCIIIQIYLNFKKIFNYEKLNIFFIFIISSIVSPIIFFLFSPILISIYHFLNILLFSCFFYILLNLYNFCYEYFLNSKINKNIFIILLFLYISSNFFILKNEINYKFKKYNDLEKIQNFLKLNNLNNTKLTLFTNDPKIMTMWLLNKNSQLAISDGFTNILKNSQIEFNLINNLKDFKISENDFKKIISFEKNEIRNPLFMTLFTVMYQANSLYTYSNLENYANNFQELIKKISPFRVQIQIVPQNEKRRLIKLFNDHLVDKRLLSDYVILNYSQFTEKITINNNNYEKVFLSTNYEIYKRLKKN